MTEILETQILQRKKKNHTKETFHYTQEESELIPIWLILTSNLSLDHTAVRMSVFNFTVL